MACASEKMSHDWADTYKMFKASGSELSSPSETVIRLFKGNYVTGDVISSYAGKTGLDVGFGNGNNTFFLASLGMDVSGVEIHQDICDAASKDFERAGLQADLRVGTNQSLPFDDNSFDYLLSWNVLHYEGSEEGIKAGLKEYSRVLKPNGRLFLSTTGPTHKILADSETLGGHRYKIGRADDFRKGQVHFFFDSPDYIQFYFQDHFKELQIGRIQDQLFNETLDWWIVTGTKG